MRAILRKNKLNIAIFLFIGMFILIHLYKPSLFYLPDGSFRQFGVGYKHKTVFPIWIGAIILAILTYVGVSYYIMYL